MFATILVPLDGSDLAMRALPYAVRLARANRARLVLLHAASAKAVESNATAEVDTVLAQDDLADHLRERGVRATTWLVYGDAGPAIADAAVDLRADLIVMSTHGRGGLGRLVHGSVADYVLRHVPVPVVLVTAKSVPAWTDGHSLRVLVPLDGSSFAEKALGPASELAETLRADLVLLRTAELSSASGIAPWSQSGRPHQQALDEAMQYLEQVAVPLRAAGHRTALRVAAGHPADMIASVAADLSPGLVVMATHGRGMLSRLVLESVAAEVLRRLTVPVLLVRPAERDGSLVIGALHNAHDHPAVHIYEPAHAGTRYDVAR